MTLMPRATAIWLIENTALTFEQIADFCSIHPIEVQAIADGQACVGMKGADPILMGQLTEEDIERCVNDPSQMLPKSQPKYVSQSSSKKKYITLSKRQERPDAIAWLIKNYPEMTDLEIRTLLATTLPIVKSVREKTHPRIDDLSPRSPVSIGLCTQDELDAVINKKIS